LVLDIYAQIADWFTSSLIGENTLLNNLAALFTIGVIVIAPLTFFGKQWWNKRVKKIDVSKSLHAELKDALNALDGTAGRQVMEIEVNGVKKYYTLTFMNYDMYDSLIFSGEIQVINYDLQQKIQDIFRRIKSHKESLKYAAELGDKAKLYDKKMDETTLPIYEHIADIESELEKLIPEAINELEKNFSPS